MSDKIMKIDTDKIPVNSSLGLLAYGHVAFTAWRKIKMDYKIKTDKEKRNEEK